MIYQAAQILSPADENVVSVFCFYEPLLSVALPSSSLVNMAVSIPHCVVNSHRLSLDDDRLREDFYFEALAFSRHTTNLELDEEIMKPENATKAPRNSGIDPGTMKMKQWYQGQDRLSDKSQWQLPSNRVRDKKAPTGTRRASYQAREPIAGDEERLAMRRGDMPSEKFNVTNDPQLSLQRILGNNHADVILTAEADSSPTDAMELLNDCGFVGCHSSRGNDLSVHARIDSSGYSRLLWELDVDDRNGLAAIFEVKFGKTSEAVKESLARSARKAATSVPLRTPLSPRQVASMTPRRGIC